VLGKQLEQTTPSVRRFDCRSHGRRARTVPFQMTVFEIDASGAVLSGLNRISTSLDCARSG